MDLTRPVAYRGLTLNGAVGGPGGNNPIEGMRLTRVKYTDVPAVGYTEKKALEDGLDASDVYLGARNVMLQGEVFAKGKDGLFDALDLLRLKFTATDCYAESPEDRGYLPLSFEVPTTLTVHWPTGYISRELRVRPLEQPDHTIDFGAIDGTVDGGWVVPFVAVLQAKDPRFYHPTAVEEPVDFPDPNGGSKAGTLTNRGNYPTPLNLLLFQPASDVSTNSINFTGMGTNMDLEIPYDGSGVDRYLKVDSYNKVVTLLVDSVETLRMDLVEFNAGTTWPRVPPTPEGDSPAGYTFTCDEWLEVPSRLFFNETWA